MLKTPAHSWRVVAVVVFATISLAGCEGSAAPDPTKVGKDSPLFKATNLTADERQATINGMRCELTSTISDLPSPEARRLAQMQQERRQASKTPPSKERICECIVDTLQDRTTLLQFRLALAVDKFSKLNTAEVAKLRSAALAGGMSVEEFEQQRREALEHKLEVGKSCGRNFSR